MSCKPGNVLSPADVAWLDDADQARLLQEPLRARRLLWSGALLVVLLLAWAAVGEVDEVTRGEGRIVPSRQLQIVQAVDGGVVEEMLAREGQVVEAGELLMRVDPTRFMSSLHENRAEFLALRAKAARLEALAQGTAFAAPEDVLAEAPEVVAHERRLYESRKKEMAAQSSNLREQLSQRRQELNEVQARHSQAVRGFSLAQQELNVTKPLEASGAVSEVELLRLEREVARLRGERDQAAAQISRIQAAISEASGKIQEVELNVRNQMSNELSDTLARISSLSAGSGSLADKVKHAELRAPVRGTVQRILVNTVGGVVQPGREVIEIVPLDDSLVAEVQIKPRDIAFLRPGQEAMVKFSAYDFAIYGGLEAELEHISADTVIDERGEASYLVRVRTREASFGEEQPVIPGMMVEVDILTGKKTILSYLAKPVLRARARALTER